MNIQMFNEKDCLYYFQHSSVIIKKLPYIAFNLTMYQKIFGSKDFTNLIFLTNLGRFKKRLRAPAPSVSNFTSKFLHLPKSI